MTRIAILDDYHNIALDSADWGSLPKGCDINVFSHHLGPAPAVIEALQDFDVIVAMRERTPFPASVIQSLPNLKLLVTTGMRNLAIDMDAARERGIPVCGTAMAPYAAFEHTWALILAITKNIPREDRCMREGGWQLRVGTGLNGKTLGVLGLGKLGSKVARVGLAFDMKVIAWSQNLTEQRARECGAMLVDKETLFERSDIVTIHLVLGDRTRGIVGKDEFARMKSSAYLVNTSRGPIVDEDALIEALQAKVIAGAAIDVFDIEPLPAHHPLRSMENTVLTGHTGYLLRETFQIAYGEAVDDVKSWLDGAPVRVLNEG
ncbi:MAG TPA: D-2-hydroxyacid dehydrogenase family protein [Gammaproteobacteria bacterium]|nr:D-2-hydroxyacid dehydrogenase family protein [Gammaproteobacteria bacterium]